MPPRRNKEKFQELTEFERGGLSTFEQGVARVQWNSSTVMQVWKQWTDEHRTTQKTVSGRRKVKSARDNRHLHSMAVKDRKASSSIAVDCIQQEKRIDELKLGKAMETSANKKARRKVSKKYGKFIEDCIPDGVFPIGDDVFVFASTYYESISVHIRRFKKYGKTYYPTPEGITLDRRWIESGPALLGDKPGPCPRRQP
ncbi:uncharacterized protein TNCV_4691691 [Trichonephila clavipes]|nr:uncharacterized protein TNCV_4691691 [Trichonephila clavipes]